MADCVLKEVKANQNALNQKYDIRLVLGRFAGMVDSSDLDIGWYYLLFLLYFFLTLILLET